MHTRFKGHEHACVELSGPAMILYSHAVLVISVHSNTILNNLYIYEQLLSCVGKLLVSNLYGFADTIGCLFQCLFEFLYAVCVN